MSLLREYTCANCSNTYLDDPGDRFGCTSCLCTEFTKSKSIYPIYFKERGQRMVRMWWGPLKDTPALEGWQAEYFTPVYHRLFGLRIWTTWTDIQPTSILEALYGR